MVEEIKENFVIIKKKWGYEKCLGSFFNMHFKELHLEGGGSTSLHYHKYKSELFYVVKGGIIVILSGVIHPVEEGSFIVISPYQLHRTVSPKGAVVLEVSTQMLGDVKRAQEAEEEENPPDWIPDDSQMGSGSDITAGLTKRGI